MLFTILYYIYDHYQYIYRSITKRDNLYIKLKCTNANGIKIKTMAYKNQRMTYFDSLDFDLRTLLRI